MAFSAVQETGATSDGTSVAKAFASDVAEDNLIVVVGLRYTPSLDDFVVGDCTKTAGTATLGSFTLDKVINRNIAGSEHLVVGVWSAVVTGAGSCTITVAGGVASSAHDVGIGEYHSDSSATFAVEDSDTGTGASGNAATGSATSAGAALFIGGVTDSNNAITTHTPDAGYSTIYEEEDGNNHLCGSATRQIVSSGTSDTAGWTLGTNTGWVAALVVYKESSAPSFTALMNATPFFIFQ